VKTTTHYLEVAHGDEILVEVEWVKVQNECTSEYGNTHATEKWDVYDSDRVTNQQTGDVWDCESKPESDWEVRVSEALLSDEIGVD